MRYLSQQERAKATSILEAETKDDLKLTMDREKEWVNKN